MYFLCPECGSKTITYARRQISPLEAVHFLGCKNGECGAAVVARDEFSRIITPSKLPNPLMPHLPVSQRAAKRRENKAKREAAAAAASLASAQPSETPASAV
jgi:predicted RNA-binding Zn-ribbon protein involved in translation (DUF1610 family)